MYFASRNPFGVGVLNRNGSQPNEMRMFSTSEKRDRWVLKDPEHRQREHAHCVLVQSCKRQAKLIGWPVPYIDP